MITKQSHILQYFEILNNLYLPFKKPDKFSSYSNSVGLPNFH